MSDPQNDNSHPLQLTRRAILAVLRAAAAAPLAATVLAAPHAPDVPFVPDFDLDELTIDELQKGMASGCRSRRGSMRSSRSTSSTRWCR